MSVRVCEDDGLRIICKPVRRAVLSEQGLVLETAEKTYVVRKENYRVLERRYPLFPLLKRRYIIYYVQDIPVNKAPSVADYAKLKHLEVEAAILRRTELRGQVLIYLLVAAAIAIAALVVAGMAVQRPIEVVVNIPTNATMPPPPPPAEEVIVPPPPPPPG